MRKKSLTEENISDEELMVSWKINIFTLSLLYIARFLDYKYFEMNYEMWKIRIDEMINRLKPKTPLVKLKKLLLFVWLQDLNWSGSKNVYHYLHTVPLN